MSSLNCKRPLTLLWDCPRSSQRLDPERSWADPAPWAEEGTWITRIPASGQALWLGHVFRGKLGAADAENVSWAPARTR
jgi:hypothetical protein